MKNERRPSRSVFWPLFLIAIGIVYLLVNLDLISRPTLLTILRLWPFILIGIGLDLIFKNSFPAIRPLIAAGVVAGAIVMVAFGQSLGLGADDELSTERISEPVGGASSVRITLDLARYQTSVDGLASSETLIDAELDTLGSIEFAASGTDEKSISLGEKSDSRIGFNLFDFLSAMASDASWEIHLNADVPLDLTIDVASGSAALNLADLTLTSLVIDGGSGSSAVTLPGGNLSYDALFDGGSGSFAVTIADGAEANVVFDGGSGSLTLGVGNGADVQAEIYGGSGSTRIEVPEGAAVRVVIRDNASGSVSIPSRFEMIDDLGDSDSDTGIWETPGYDRAERKIEIVFDPGSGSFAVR